MLGTFGTMAIAALITQGFIRPGLKRYEVWKKDPKRVQVARRDWRGRHVPDLMIIRVERALWCLLAAIILLGVAFWVHVYSDPNFGVPQFERAT
jgi:hypothetical protein